MSDGEEEHLKPAFEDGAQWKGTLVHANGEEEEIEILEKSDMSLSIVREGDGVNVFVLNASGEDVVSEARPIIEFAFAPAELMKFDMPSVPSSEKATLVIPAKKSVKLVTGTLKGASGRWVFQWASDNGSRTHQCSYTLHPKGCQMTIKVSGLGLGHCLEESIKL